MRMKYGLWSFSKFVPTDVVRQVLNAGNNEAQLGVKMREVTLLFSDIAGFTSIAERMEPNELLLLLSDYFTMMAEVIHELGGTLLEFIGDAILAIWNAPQVSHIAERARAADLRNERTSTLERSRFCFSSERGCGGWIRFGRDTTPNLAVARRDPVSPVA